MINKWRTRRWLRKPCLLSVAEVDELTGGHMQYWQDQVEKAKTPETLLAAQSQLLDFIQSQEKFALFYYKVKSISGVWNGP